MFQIVEIAFEWFVTVIWERRGPVAGIISDLLIAATMIGIVFAAISLW